MSYHKHFYGPVLVTFGLLSGGCTVDSGNPSGEDVAESTAALSEAVLVWDSGYINSLSDWESRECAVHCSGVYNNCMLTGFNAYKEPTTTSDNFIGKLDGTCTDYTTRGVQTGTPETDNIFTGSWRSGSYTVSVDSNTVPVGVKLKVHDGGWVKDIAVGERPAFGAATTWSGWATGYDGDVVTKTCDPGKVMTGLELKYDLDNGKIRKVQIFCRW
jgi:hypothetical protein